MSQESIAHPPEDKTSSDPSPEQDFEPTDAMKRRNRRLGMLFLAVIAGLVLLTVVTRIILSS